MQPRSPSRSEEENSQPRVPIQEFRFIDSSGTASGPRRGRRDVRSFVMQNARRNRPWSTSKHATKEDSASRNKDKPLKQAPDDVGDDSQDSSLSLEKPRSTRRKVTSQKTRMPADNMWLCLACTVNPRELGVSLCGRCNSLLPLSASAHDPGSGNFDPFDTLPVRPNHAIMRLLDHYLNTVIPTTIPLDIHGRSDILAKGWFRPALSNAAFMQSILCSAAVHSYVLGSGSYEEILQHKIQAVAAVNANFADPVLSIGDANIAAVFTLLCIEESLLLPLFEEHTQKHDEGPKQRRWHLNGLCRMLQLRGGLRELESNPCLQALISWHATGHSIASFYQPYAALTDSNGTPIQYSVRVILDVGPSAYTMLDICYHLLLSRGLLELISDLCHYTASLNLWFESSSDPNEALGLQTQSSVLEHRLIRYMTVSNSVISTLEQTLCLSMLAFVVKSSAPDDQSFDPLQFTVTQRLYSSITALGLQSWELPPELQLWIHTIAAMSAQHSIEEQLFLRFARSSSQALGLNTFEAFLAQLKKCLWVSSKLNRGAEWVWDAIMS